MGFSLRNFFEEAVSQVNPFDNGRSAVTVRRDRQVEAARTLRKKREDEEAVRQVQRQANQRNVQALRSGQISRDQYQQQTNRIFNNEKPQLHSFKSVNPVRDFFDSDSGLDQLKRTQAGQPTMYRDQQIAMGNKRPYESFGAQAVGNLARYGNTIGAGISQIPATVRGEVAMRTGNQEALSNALTAQKNMRDFVGQPDSGLLGVGTIYDNPNEMTELGNKEMAKRVGLTTLGAASEALPFARVARPVAVGGKTGLQLFKGGAPVTSRLIKSANAAERGASGLATRAAFNAGIDATTGAGESVARQYAQTGKVNPMTVLGDTAASTILGQTQLVPAYARHLNAPKGLTPEQLAERNRWVRIYNEAEAKGKVVSRDIADAKITEIDRNAMSPIGRQVDKRIKKVRADSERIYGEGDADLSQNLPNTQLQKQVSQSPSDTNPLESLKQEARSTTIKELPNRPSTRMSVAEKESLFASVPAGTEKQLKVTQPNTKSNIPVSKLTKDGDTLTATNVNPNIKKGEKRFAIDDSGELIPDTKGAYRIFTDDEGRVKSFRIGKEVYSAKDLGDLSDVNNYGSSMATMRRNIERAFGEKTGDKVGRFLVDHQQAQATKMITRQVELKESMKSLAKELGINFASGTRKAKKVSAAIQELGEGKRTKQSLVAEFGQEQADKIVKADKWFRQQYDSLLDEMNTTLTQYGYDPVPKRKNYYTHFQDNSVWRNFGLKMQEVRNLASPTMQDALPTETRGNVPNKLAGQTEYLQPNKRFNQFALQRKGDQTVIDAFQAFERYLAPTLNNIYMTPSITRARVLSKAVAQDADIMGKDASPVIRQTIEWANRLAGKTNRFDRAMVDTKLGNQAIKAMQWAQKKAGQNSIVGNLSTAFMQPIVLQQTAGKFGFKNTILGFMQEMGDSFRKDSPIDKSSFIKRRYSDLTPVTAGKMDKARNAANTPLQIIEETTARATWHAAHNDALAKGLKGNEAIRYADVQAEKTLAGRSIGEKPELFESKAAGLVTMYQLEVNNFWQQITKEMTKGQAARAMVAAYGLNLVLQEVSGRQVGFNPIDAIIDSYQETQKEDKSIGDKAKTIGQRFAGEVVDNTPLLAPALNTVIGDRGIKSLTGKDSNTGRFGVSSPITSLWNNPEDMILPFGGAQIRKTIGAYQALRDGGLTDKNDKQTIQVTPSPSSTAKGLIFGKNAIPEINQYYDNLGKKKVDQKEIPNQKPKAGAVGDTIKIGDKTEKNEDGKYVSRDKYDAIINAYEGGAFDKNIQKYDRDELQTAIKSVADESKEAFKQAGLPLIDEVKFDSNMAQKYAKYRKSIEGKNDLEVQKKTQSFFKDTYMGVLDDTSRSFWSLGDNDMRYELQQGTINKEQMDKIIGLDNILTSEGLQSYPQVGKTLRRELGYGVIESGSGKSKYAKKSSGKKSGGRKGARRKFDFFAYGNPATSVNKTLQQLLEAALVG